MAILDALNRKITARLPVKMVKNKAKSAIASISFDDFPHSAWRVGGKILKAQNAKATYYAVGDFCGKTIDGIEQYNERDLIELAENGHEIASHTLVHKAVYKHSNVEIRRMERDNELFFQKHLGDYRLASFAYPYGEISPRTKMAYSEIYASSRGIRDGINGKWFDLAQLKAVGIEKRHYDKGRIENYIQEAKAQNAWLIFFSHDIDNDPSPYGATPKMLEDTLQAINDNGIEILTVKAACAKTQFEI